MSETIRLQVLLDHEAGPHLEYHDFVIMPMKGDSFYLDDPDMEHDEALVKVIRRVIYRNAVSVIVYKPNR